jgi:hypothetical protein
VFNFLKTIFTPQPTEEFMGYIKETSDGRFAVTDRSGSILKTYSRRRDAKRGATRLGLAVA